MRCPADIVREKMFAIIPRRRTGIASIPRYKMNWVKPPMVRLPAITWRPPYHRIRATGRLIRNTIKGTLKAHWRTMLMCSS
ncbi:hypothetical protein ES703_104753 [subsurface metagenome]